MAREKGRLAGAEGAGRWAEYGMAKAPRLCRRRSSAACHLACAKGGKLRDCAAGGVLHVDWDWTDRVAGA